MLRRLSVNGFKSLRDVTIAFPKMSVLFGPNAAGKSNILDAVQALSRVAGSRTLGEALSEPIRGYPQEAFTLPQGGLEALMSLSSARFDLEAELGLDRERFLYRVGLEIQPRSGSLSVCNEYLASLTKTGEPKGSPSIDSSVDKSRIRRKGKAGKPREEDLGRNFAVLSDLRLGSPYYSAIQRCRQEVSGWRTYYLDPRNAMREARPPREVADVGVRGEDIAPFLYRLKTERPKHFEAVRRSVRAIVPSVERLSVELNERRGTLDILVSQDGTDFSSRIVSEGTLRVVALCAIAVNPWAGSLVAFEEPENGVHPRRLELIAKLLLSLAVDQGRQVIVTTHSPLLCDRVLTLAHAQSEDVALFNVRRRGRETTVTQFDVGGPLFTDHEIAQGLTARGEDGLFEGLMLRGLLDE